MPRPGSKKLRAHFAKLRAQRALARVKARFKATKRERNSFVFVDTKGKRRGIDSRAKGFLFYVDSAGRRTLQSAGKTGIPQRFRDFDVSRSRHKRAVAKWERSLKLSDIGRTFTVRSSGSVSFESLSRAINKKIARTTGIVGTGQVLVVEMAVHSKGRIVRTKFLLTGSELKAYEKGKKKFLSRLAWKAISTELSIDNLVTETSAAFIRALRGNRGKRKSKWKDSRGDTWGKGAYKTVRITRIDIRTKVSGRHFK